ncbi:hypothetical protein HAX54_011597 [Datura stramonium]|uniref:Bifunctional inhibitor/plant lipid transfer protein/seed storage helical domain-containing protein n=1 Tax=Datura stramonium TaxID=4076 RepID=A0ABS8TJ77_DATST|nr:hypothetical protein [Datura stramonium]
MVKLIYTVIILLLVLATPAMAEPSFDIVEKRLAPCHSYIQGRKDYIDVCKCIKRALLHMTYDPYRIQLGSQQCHTVFDLPPVGHNTNCA